MLTVVTFLYRGYRRGAYKPAHVQALARMVAEHLTLPHRFVAIADEDVPGVETFPAWPAPEVLGVPPWRYNNYRCLRLFDIAEQFGKRLLVLDLDLLIRRNIDHLITADAFKIIRGRAAPYNSSAYLMRAGAHRHVWSSFDPLTVEKVLAQQRMPSGKRWIGSDQSWISYTIPGAPMWDEVDGVAHIRRASRDNTALVYWSGAVKPWDALARMRHPLYHREYMRWL